MRLPLSSSLPSPTARTLPFCGFSLAVSGSTRPLAVVSSSSIARTIRRSPRGLSFIFEKPPSRDCGGSLPSGSGPRPPLLALSGGECQPSGSIYRRSGGDPGFLGTRTLRLPAGRGRRAPAAGAAPGRALAAGPASASLGAPPGLVLRAAEALDGFGHARGLLDDL